MTANRFLPTFSRYSRPGSAGRIRSPSVTFSPSSSTPPCAISRRASVLLGASPAFVITATSGMGSADSTVRTLQLPPDQQIELLVSPAQLDVRFERHRVVPLNQGVQKLVDADGLLVAIALLEIIALEHPGHAVVRAQMDELLGRHPVHPPAVEIDDGPLGIQDFVDLALVGLGVLPHFLLRML